MADMGRRRTSGHDLPPRLHLNHGAYFYVSTTIPRKWTNLGRDRAKALVKWAELEGGPIPPGVKTLAAVWQRYEREKVPGKALSTQADNRKEVANLLAVFGTVAVDEITPQHVRKYLDLRSEAAPVRAKREKALLSHMINCARGWGLSDAPNPCAGIKGQSTPGRDRYVEDAEYKAVWDKADQPVRDAMDLALLTGQRPSDVLRLTRADVRDGALWLRQGKTGKRMRIAIEGELAAVIDRCNARVAPASKVASLHLIRTEQGQPLTQRCLQDRFSKARAKAGITDFQFRDIRAKTASDVENLAHAQKLLGHQSAAMTEHYTRERTGRSVKPLR